MNYFYLYNTFYVVHARYSAPGDSFRSATPIMDIVELGMLESEARQCETYWIQYHRDRGVLLTNRSQNSKALVFEGYRFRNTFHMEWAMFFSISHIAYQYQKNSIRIKGTMYSPDFWLPDEQYWIYIRAQELARYDKEEADDLLKASKYPYRFYFGHPEMLPAM